MESFDNLDWDQLMDLEAKQSEPLELSDADAKRYHQRTLLYKMEQGYALPLMPEAHSGVAFLQDTLNELLAEGYLAPGSTHYELTAAGRQELENMGEQYHSLVSHYDVFAEVDIDNGCFLEPGDDPQETVIIDGEAYPRFIDLRVAVMRFKGIDPFDMVFLNLLRENRIASKDNWEFDMALGKSLYAELEEIVNSAYTVKDLTDLQKTNDDGEIPGSDILKDVIVAGNALNQERAAAVAESAKQRASQRPEVNVQVVNKPVQQPLFVEHHYAPTVYYEEYYDPFYVEPAWRHHRYRPWFH